MVNKKIKEFQISISEMANTFKCTRPTIYNYIKAYDTERRDLLPDDVKDFLDFVDASEYLSNQNIFVLLHGGNPRKPLGEDNPLFAEGIVYLKSSNVKKILGELKRESRFPERKGKFVYIFRSVAGNVQITFVLLDKNIIPENKYYSKLEGALEVESVEEIHEIFTHEVTRVLTNFKANREKQKAETSKFNEDELSKLIKEFDKNDKNPKNIVFPENFVAMNKQSVQINNDAKYHFDIKKVPGETFGIIRLINKTTNKILDVETTLIRANHSTQEAALDLYIKCLNMLFRSVYNNETTKLVELLMSLGVTLSIDGKEVFE